jgi:hypothetical protein
VASKVKVATEFAGISNELDVRGIVELPIVKDIPPEANENKLLAG